MQDFDQLSAEGIGASVLTDMLAGNFLDDNPMHFQAMKSQKGPFQHFRSSYLEFWDRIVKASDAIGTFHTNQQTQEDMREDSLENPTSLFDSVLDMLAVFSGLRARRLRLAATEAGLQVISSLVHKARVSADTRDLKQRQLDAERKKKRPNRAIAKSLHEGLASAQNSIRSAETMIQGAFNRIFTHRFRDIDPSIRSACMYSIGQWMCDLPLFFLSDFYLKYLGWSLNDKDSRVRVAAISSLLHLYQASSENVALMDTFNARFILRICEMLDDVEPHVVANAVKTLGALHVSGVLSRQDMDPVVSLLMHEDIEIRGAAASVIPLLIRCEVSQNTDVLNCASFRATDKTPDDKQLRSSTLLAIIHMTANLHGSRARIASVVHALWDIYEDIFTDWNLLFSLLLTDGSDYFQHNSLKPNMSLNTSHAAGLSNLILCTVRRARGEELVKSSNICGHPMHVLSKRHVTKSQRVAQCHAHELFTQASMNLLPSVMRKWKSDEQVLVPLIEAVRYLKLEHYSLKHKEDDFGAIIKLVAEVFFLHSSKRVMDACMDVLCQVIGEGTVRFREMCAKCSDDLFSIVASKIDEIVGVSQSEHHHRNVQNGNSLDKRHRTPPIKNDDIDHLQIQIALLRLNSFLSFMALPLSLSDASHYDIIHNNLLTIISDVINGPSRFQVHSAALATRAAAMLLVQRAVLAVEESPENDKHNVKYTALKTDFMDTVAAACRSLIETNSCSRLLAKAFASSVTNLVVYSQPIFHSPALGNPVSVEEEQNTGHTFCLTDSTLRAVWDVCNHLIDIPHKDGYTLDSPARDSAVDDEEMSRLAYNLAMCDVALMNRGFVASELFANLGQSGHWTDCAIRSLMTDLRFLGPQAAANTIMTSLASAFEEVISEEIANNDDIVDAFGELAFRLADMFTVGSHRDRMVVRCIIDEGLKYVVPHATPHPSRLQFLALGLGPFVAKLASGDAKALVHPLAAVVSVIEEDDDLYAPLFAFVKVVATRARGTT